MIYFAWAEEHECFDANVHLRHDLPIFQLSIVHTEHTPPRAEILIPSHEVPKDLPEKAWAFFSYGPSKETLQEAYCVFRGKLHTMASQGKDLLKLEFQVTSESRKQALERLRETLMQKKFFHPLVHSQKDPDLGEILKTQPMALYWDRVTGKVSLSHAVLGSHTWSVEHHDPQRFSYHQTPPIGQVDLTLQVQWIQQVYGFFNVAPYLADAFEEGCINTYTKFKNWPQTGQTMGSGYSVLYSRLEERDPPQFLRSPTKGGIRLQIPRSNPQAPHQRLTESVWIKRFWLKGELLLSWNLRQKRAEQVHVSVKSSLQNPDLATSVSLKLPLQKIVQVEDIPWWKPYYPYKKGDRVQKEERVYRCLSDFSQEDDFQEPQWEEDFLQSAWAGPGRRSSFFLTQSGYEVLDYGLKKAQTILTWGARCVHITLQGEARYLAHITLDHRVMVRHPHLPVGHAVGKVTAYKLLAKGDTGHEEVILTVSCSIGASPPQEIKESNPVASYVQGYAVPLYHVHYTVRQAMEGMEYYRYDDQYPTDPYAQLASLLPQDMIRSIRISHLPQQQENILEERASTAQKLFTASGLETKIYLELQPLKGYECLSHTLRPILLGPWYPAQDIKLSPGG